jgi:uncharacterized protein (TIGR01777 family)
MKILITGASGLIGKALQNSFAEKGHDLLLAGRSEPRAANQIQWTIENGFAEPRRLEGIDAFIHLAGENISALRWTDEKKRAIRDSRVLGTRSVVDAIGKLKQKPKVFIAGSATGYYGDRGDEVMTENDVPGDTFLSEVCKAWEAESRRAEDLGIRSVLLRTGIVLSKDGGALAEMLTPFKLGVGGVVGSGRQWMSWISLEDVVGAINFALENDELSGPINIVAPNPVTNKEFTRTLGEVIHRPTILPLPQFAVKLAFGEMGDALLLDSTRVAPERLTNSGFKFKFEKLKLALRNALQ